MASVEKTRLKKKYLKRAKHLMSVNSSSPPKRKPKASVGPYCVHNQDSCYGSVKGCHLCNTSNASSLKCNSLLRDDDLCADLKSRLIVLINVNKELKRLLIASVGSDILHQLEQIVYENAELSFKLNESLQKLIAAEEDMDLVSIECDVWRSKYLASRLMIDELSGWKAELTMQYEESQQALQYMIREREQLSQTLLLASSHLHKAIEVHNIGSRDVKAEQASKRSTVLDVGNSLKAMSQTFHCQAANENNGTDNSTTPVQICEPTVGEVFARQVLSSQHKKSQDRSPPVSLQVNSQNIYNIMNNNLRHNVFQSDHNMNFPFCCKCKGKIIAI